VPDGASDGGAGPGDHHREPDRRVRSADGTYQEYNDASQWEAEYGGLYTLRVFTASAGCFGVEILAEEGEVTVQ